MEPIIKLDNISMHFNMANEKVDNLKEYFIKIMKKQLFFKDFTALDNVNVEIKRGEVFGIVGRNGAGKSTLLKIIAGVLKPTTGSIKINGTMAPLIELGAGFDIDLSAKENVFLNGAILGYSEKEMKQKYDEIVEFSELKDFMNVAIKNFSSGMYARLGFSIATAVRPDILIVDEILSVGDMHFQKKCQERISNMMKSGTTVVIVSHSIGQIEELCDRVLWIEHGKVHMLGETEEVCTEYKKSCN